MVALEVFVQGKFMTLISESYWCTLNSGCLHGLPCFLFALLLGFAKANHTCWIQICCETSWSFSGNTSSKNKICCRKWNSSLLWATCCLNLQHCIFLRDKLVTNLVIRATMCFTFQCNNVARQVGEKFCPYYQTFHTYPDIFKSATFSFRIQKFPCPHVGYSNWIRLSTRIRWYPDSLKYPGLLCNKNVFSACAIKGAIVAANMLFCCYCAAILVCCSVREWTRICYVIGSENIRIHPSTRYLIRCRFIFFHFGERFKNFQIRRRILRMRVDRKPYPERKVGDSGCCFAEDGK